MLVFTGNIHLDRRTARVVWQTTRLFFPANDSPIAIVVRYSGFRLWTACAAHLLGFRFYCQDCSSEALRDMRQMERVPNVSPITSYPGRSAYIEGQSKRQNPSARYTKIPCLYHRYLKERGKGFGYAMGHCGKWFEGTDFFLGDETKVLVKLSRKGATRSTEITGRGRAGTDTPSGESRNGSSCMPLPWRVRMRMVCPCALIFPVRSHLFYPMMERWKIGPTMEPKEFC